MGWGWRSAGGVPGDMLDGVLDSVAMGGEGLEVGQGRRGVDGDGDLGGLGEWGWFWGEGLVG